MDKREKMKRTTVKIISSLSLLINGGLFYNVCYLNHQLSQQRLEIQKLQTKESNKERKIQKLQEAKKNIQVNQKNNNRQ